MALTNAERQKRWREKNAGWVKLREKNRWLKKKASVTVEANPVTKAVSSRNVNRNDYPHFGDELRYEAEPGVDVGYGPMEPKPKGGPGAAEKILEPVLPLTENEARTYVQLEEFKARRARMEKGVQVELIL